MGLEAPVSRAAAAERLIRQAGAFTNGDRGPRIQRYRFGSSLAAMGSVGPGLVPEPGDGETRLVSALEDLPSRFEEGVPFGVFVFSDGRSTELEGFDHLARVLSEARRARFT